ncbi:MAG: glycosyltransferase [Acidimicrobiia bacterium]
MDGPLSPGGDRIRVTVVVVVFGDEPWLERSIDAILGSVDVDVELVLVENGGSESVIAGAAADARVRVVRPGHNSGFAMGCDLGVAAGTAPLVALVNPDAIVEPDALRALCATASSPGIGLATASIRLADRPDRLNCAGNLVTVTGISWADHFGELADRFPEQFDVVGASGAGLAIRRSLWDDLGGFNESFFAYWEDTELSIRAIQRGWRVVYEPDAVIVHRYSFSRNPSKFFLLERNRSVTALTCFSTRHLMAIAPLSAVIEIGLLVMAVRQRRTTHRRTARQYTSTTRPRTAGGVSASSMFRGDMLVESRSSSRDSSSVHAACTSRRRVAMSRRWVHNHRQARTFSRSQR